MQPAKSNPLNKPLRIGPVTLRGEHVELQPLSLAHVDALWMAGSDPEVWRWYTTPVTSREEMRENVEAALRFQEAGSALPFATVDTATGEVVGSTRYMNIVASDRHVEIGSTWITAKHQRTAINTEAKYLMLRHAFETLGCVRVELKTDSLNEKSRKAILRIGAREEGIFRNHMICHDGRLRHTVWFSIIDTEWPQAKADLERKLQGR